MPNPRFELFLNSATMLEAEQALISLGEDAISELQSLFSGESKNQFGVRYRDLGLPLRCALEVAIRLGPIARPLEPFLRDELQRDGETAARALGALGALERDSVAALAARLDGAIGSMASAIPLESAIALIRCGCADHPLVLEVLQRSAMARENWQRSLSHVQLPLRGR